MAYSEEALSEISDKYGKLELSHNEVVKSPLSSCLKIERAKRRLDTHF